MSEKKEKPKASLNSKLVRAQESIGAIKKDSTNPYFNSKYFDINELLSTIKPVLNNLGLVLLQPIVVRDGRNALETALVDAESGETYSSLLYLPDITDPQKMGSTLTYYRRYALQSLLALEAEDDDGNSVSAGRSTVAIPPMRRPTRSEVPATTEGDELI